MSYDGDDEDTIVSEAVEIPDDDVNLIDEFKQLIQKTKAAIYKGTVTNQKETINGTNLDGLHKYEVELYSIGTHLLKGLFEFENTPLKNTPTALWKIVIDPELSTDVRILFENEIRTQFIQHPYTRITSNNI